MPGPTKSLASGTCITPGTEEQIASVVRLRCELERPPAVPIEQAASLLNISVRTLYRRRAEFEHRRQKRHLYFTLRGIQEHIEIEQYNPSPSFDVTVPVEASNALESTTCRRHLF